jgi:hypothetical protein
MLDDDGGESVQRAAAVIELAHPRKRIRQEVMAKVIAVCWWQTKAAE